MIHVHRFLFGLAGFFLVLCPLHTAAAELRERATIDVAFGERRVRLLQAIVAGDGSRAVLFIDRMSPGETVRVHDCSDGKKVFEVSSVGGQGVVAPVGITADGARLLLQESSFQPKSVHRLRMIDLATGQTAWESPFNGFGRAVISEDGGVAVTHEAPTVDFKPAPFVRLLALDDGAEKLKSNVDPKLGVGKLQASSSGRSILCLGGVAPHHSWDIFDPHEGRAVATLQDTPRDIEMFQFLGDREEVVAVAPKRLLRWNARTGELLAKKDLPATPAGGGLYVFSTDATRLFVQTEKVLQVVDTSDGRLLTEAPLPAALRRLRAASSAKTMLFAAGDGTLRVVRFADETKEAR
jgi:hypothetical protein